MGTQSCSSISYESNGILHAVEDSSLSFDTYENDDKDEPYSSSSKGLDTSSDFKKNGTEPNPNSLMIDDEVTCKRQTNLTNMARKLKLRMDPYSSSSLSSFKQQENTCLHTRNTKSEQYFNAQKLANLRKKREELCTNTCRLRSSKWKQQAMYPPFTTTTTTITKNTQTGLNNQSSEIGITSYEDDFVDCCTSLSSVEQKTRYIIPPVFFTKNVTGQPHILNTSLVPRRPSTNSDHSQISFTSATTTVDAATTTTTMDPYFYSYYPLAKTNILNNNVHHENDSISTTGGEPWEIVMENFSDVIVDDEYSATSSSIHHQQQRQNQLHVSMDNNRDSPSTTIMTADIGDVEQYDYLLQLSNLLWGTSATTTTSVYTEGDHGGGDDNDKTLSYLHPISSASMATTTTATTNQEQKSCNTIGLDTSYTITKTHFDYNNNRITTWYYLLHRYRFIWWIVPLIFILSLLLQEHSYQRFFICNHSSSSASTDTYLTRYCNTTTQAIKFMNEYILDQYKRCTESLYRYDLNQLFHFDHEFRNLLTLSSLLSFVKQTYRKVRFHSSNIIQQHQYDLVMENIIPMDEDFSKTLSNPTTRAAALSGDIHNQSDFYHLVKRESNATKQPLSPAIVHLPSSTRSKIHFPSVSSYFYLDVVFPFERNCDINQQLCSMHEQNDENLHPYVSLKLQSFWKRNGSFVRITNISNANKYSQSYTLTLKSVYPLQSNQRYIQVSPTRYNGFWFQSKDENASALERQRKDNEGLKENDNADDLFDRPLIDIAVELFRHWRQMNDGNGS